MDSEGKAPEEWATTEAACFFVKDDTTTSPGRGATNKQMTPFDRRQCVQMSVSPLRTRIERAILRQGSLNSF